MICPKCGAQNMDGVTFCGSCGAQLLYTPPPVEPQQNVSYGQQQQYQQPQYQQQPPPYGSGSAGSSNYNAIVTPSGNPSNSNAFPPKNYLTESVIVTILFIICCCSPISVILGIIAIIKANNVNQEFNKGNYAAAVSNSESAKKLSIWAVIVGIAFYVIVFILYVAFFAAIISEMGGWQELINSLN